MTRNEFIQKATVAGIEAGKHPSIAVRDAQFAASELERCGVFLNYDFTIVPNPWTPNDQFYITCENK